MDELLRALALMLVLEGILPFLSPDFLRRLMAGVIRSDDRTLRLSGLVSMIAGVVLVYLLR